MINAAKADGSIGEAEIERIAGKLGEDGLSREEKEFFVSEANKPMERKEAPIRNRPRYAASTGPKSGLPNMVRIAV